MYEAHKDLEKHINTRANLEDTEYPVTREMQDVSEEGFPVEESIPVEYSAEFDEYNEKAKTGEPAEEADSFAAHLKKYVKLISAATAVAAALGISIFGIGTPKTAPGGTTAPTLPTVTPVTPTANAYGDTADQIRELPPSFSPPDRDGWSAWSSDPSIPGYSEEFLRILEPGAESWSYLTAGEAWTEKGAGLISGRSDISYDEESNTLTLNNFKAERLETNAMGGLTILLKGDSHIGQLVVWGSNWSNNIILAGGGTLTVNEDKAYPYGVLCQAEGSAALFWVNGYMDEIPTLDVYGSVAAFMISDSSRIAKNIFYTEGVEMIGGKRTAGYFTLDPDGDFAYAEDPFLFTVDDDGVISLSSGELRRSLVSPYDGQSHGIAFVIDPGMNMRSLEVREDSENQVEYKGADGEFHSTLDSPVLVVNDEGYLIPLEESDFRLWDEYGQMIPINGNTFTMLYFGGLTPIPALLTDSDGRVLKPINLDAPLPAESGIMLSFTEIEVPIELYSELGEMPSFEEPESYENQKNIFYTIMDEDGFAEHVTFRPVE